METPVIAIVVVAIAFLASIFYSINKLSQE